MAGRGAPKGHPRWGGRKKGAPNKFTGDLKAMILGALEACGGQTYLQKQASENPGVFLALVGKVLPLQVQADVKSELTVRIPIHEHRPAVQVEAISVEPRLLSPPVNSVLHTLNDAKDSSSVA